MSSNLLKVAYRCPICSSDQTDYITKSEGTTECLHAGENIYAIYYETLLECKKCLNSLQVNYHFDNLTNSYEVENILDPLAQTEYYFSISMKDAEDVSEPGLEEADRKEQEPEIVPSLKAGGSKEEKKDVDRNEMSDHPVEEGKTEEENPEDLNESGLEEAVKEVLEPDTAPLPEEESAEEQNIDVVFIETSDQPVEENITEKQNAADLNEPAKEEPESDIVLSLIEEIAEEQYLEVDFETIGGQFLEEEKEGTNEFLKWLNTAEIGFLHIDQNQDAFASLFKQNVKRPDYLIQTDSLGMIAVDVKTSEKIETSLLLDLDNELKKALEFERLFRIPVWFVFEKNDFSKWYWISASKAIEVGDIQVKSEDNTKVVVIDVRHFTKMTNKGNLGKL